MKNKPVRSDSLIKLIEVAARCGVSKFKYGELEVEFGGPAHDKILTPEFTPPPLLSPVEIEEMKAFERARERERRQEELDVLRITDPLEYETIMQKDDAN